jgi:pimeloyl-ACP methyl ester carboxylesterase
VHTAPIRDADDEARWVAEVHDGLGIDAAHVVNPSFGGWLALNLALRRPDRVCSVVGVEPVWRRLGIRTMARGVTVLAAAAAPAPICRWAADRLHQPFLWDPRLGRVGRLAYTRFANGHPDPSASPTSSWPGSTAPSRACSARAARSPHRESCAVA